MDVATRPGPGCCELPATVIAEKVPRPNWRRPAGQSASRRFNLPALWGVGVRDMTSLPARFRLACFNGFLFHGAIPDQSRNYAGTAQRSPCRLPAFL